MKVSDVIKELIIDGKKQMALMPNLFSKSIFHHGTCSICKERQKLCLHYNYDIQMTELHFKVCKDCANLMQRLFMWREGKLK